MTQIQRWEYLTAPILTHAAKQILATLRTLGEQASFAEFWPLLRRG